jgi:hypothetical protein
MEIKEKLAEILRDNIPKYLKYTYAELRPRVDSCVAITEFADFLFNGESFEVQLELNPIYVLHEEGENVIVSDFFINDGRVVLSTTICFPEHQNPYVTDGIYEASVPGLPVKIYDL